MPNLFTIWTEPKRFVHCDHHCYDSHKSGKEDCSCICCGVNHGVGYDQALANTAAYWRTWLAIYQTTHTVINVETACSYTVNTKTARTIARMLNRVFLPTGRLVMDVRQEQRRAYRKGKTNFYRRWEWIVEFNDGSEVVFHKLRLFKQFVAEQTAAVQIPMFPKETK